MATSADWKVVLLREVGAGLDGMPDEVKAAVLDMVTPFMDTYWEMNRRHSMIWPDLQYLYTKRMCLEILMGQNRTLMTVSIGGANVPQQQIVDRIEKMRDAVQEEIERIEERARASRQPVMAMMASTNQMDAAGRLFNPLGSPSPFNRRII